jgi:hypothetical protein
MVRSAYTHAADRKPSGDAEERQQHITNSSSNGNSSGTPFFSKKKETHLKPRCGIWTGQTAKETTM